MEDLIHLKNKIRKELRIMKGPLKVDNPIISKVDRYEM